MKPILTLCAAILISLTTFAQTENKNTETNNLKHGLGAAAGYTTGYGLSYRYYHNSPFTFQLTFAPYMEDKNNIELSTGLTFMYRLVKTKYIDLFLYESNHWRYNKNENFKHNYYSSTPPEVIIEEQNYVNIGCGFGFEALAWNRISLNIMTGYAAIENFSKIHPTIEGGIYYRF